MFPTRASTNCPLLTFSNCNLPLSDRPVRAFYVRSVDGFKVSKRPLRRPRYGSAVVYVASCPFYVIVCLCLCLLIVKRSPMFHAALGLYHNRLCIILPHGNRATSAMHTSSKGLNYRYVLRLRLGLWVIACVFSVAVPSARGLSYCLQCVWIDQ